MQLGNEIQTTKLGGYQDPIRIIFITLSAHLDVTTFETWGIK